MNDDNRLCICGHIFDEHDETGPWHLPYCPCTRFEEDHD